MDNGGGVFLVGKVALTSSSALTSKRVKVQNECLYFPRHVPLWCKVNQSRYRPGVAQRVPGS